MTSRPSAGRKRRAIACVFHMTQRTSASSSFMVKYIYPGNHSFLVLDDFLNKLAKTPLQVEEIFNDRMSYFHTFVQWAKNFDAHKDAVTAKFGEFDYRRFRLYLWGAAYEFLSRSLDCYRMIIHLPEDA